MNFFALILAVLCHFSALARGDDNLTVLEAKLRKSQVKSVSYDLSFEFSKGARTYNGSTLIKTELARFDHPLQIDLVAQKVKSLFVNGHEIKKFDYRGNKLILSKKNLTKDLEIRIDFISEFNNSVSGFQNVKDPQDGSEYLYTDLEPFKAHLVFPCFDQPDLKAKFKVTVVAPKEWRVIQNELIDSQKTHGEVSTTVFRQTPFISTYLFFLGAGPFVEWEDNYKGLPIYLYARKTMEQYVDVDRIMKTTKAGLAFFNDYFGYPYPFSKYGQIFVPEFPWGGMENPGAITFSERNIFRGPVPKNRYDKRDSLILHEMAHMWFGDLVTMQWWNDLWLNESFATYTASIAQERALDSKETWIDFFHGKNWGYWQDQLPTTHPVETKVNDIREARSNFDGITYAKGGSALKQLHFFVGEKGFREGLVSYFKKYAWSNTERKDFIDSIASASNINLDDWTKKWLQTSGPNRVKVNFQCEEGKIKTFTINQTPSVSKTLSPHRTKIAFYTKDDDELELIKVEEFLFSKEVTEFSSMKGTICPDFVFPNYSDQDYALYSLDEKSLPMAGFALTALPDPLSRFMIWNMLSQMVRDTELKVSDYMSMAFEGLESEEDELVLGNLLGRYSHLRNNYLIYLTKEQREKIALNFEKLILNKFMKAKSGSSVAMIFFDFYVSIAQTSDSQVRIHEWLVKNNPPEGIVLDQDRRWSLILNLAGNGHKDSKSLIDVEELKDNSTLGKRMAFVGKASVPEREMKKIIWREFFAEIKRPNSDLEEAGGKFYGVNAPEIGKEFVNDYFGRMEKMNWKTNDDFVGLYLENLFPLKICSNEVSKLSLNSFKKARLLTSLSKRSWIEEQFELDKCVAVRKFSEDKEP